MVRFGADFGAGACAANAATHTAADARPMKMGVRVARMP